MDNLIEKYAAVLQKIYEEQTAGDYTFKGVLYEFYRELGKIDKEPSDTFPAPDWKS